MQLSLLLSLVASASATTTIIVNGQKIVIPPTNPNSAPQLYQIPQQVPGNYQLPRIRRPSYEPASHGTGTSAQGYGGQAGSSSNSYTGTPPPPSQQIPAPSGPLTPTPTSGPVIDPVTLISSSLSTPTNPIDLNNLGADFSTTNLAPTATIGSLNSASTSVTTLNLTGRNGALAGSVGTLSSILAMAVFML